MQQFEVHSLEELESLAQQFIQKHPSGIFCVEGEMGAGSACLQRQNKCLVARVGREEEGVKTLLPDWQQ